MAKTRYRVVYKCHNTSCPTTVDKTKKKKKPDAPERCATCGKYRTEKISHNKFIL